MSRSSRRRGAPSLAELVSGCSPDVRRLNPVLDTPIQVAQRTPAPPSRPAPVVLTAGVRLRLAFTIEGAPRCKNTGRSPRPGLVVPTAAYRAWLAQAKPQAERVRVEVALLGLRLPIDRPVDVTAVFYRDRNVGDEDRFKIGLGDFLERCGFVDNDKLIHWTGETRREIDRERPRVEIRLEVGGDPAITLSMGRPA